MTRAGRLRALPPGPFAPVMATGIVARALDRAAGAHRLADVLLGLAAALYAALLAATAPRALRRRGPDRGDLRDPGRLFGSFTLVAATGVLASRAGSGPGPGPGPDLGLGVLRPVAVAVVLCAAALWAVLAVSVVRLARMRGRALLRAADGTFFLATVGLQALVLALTALAGGPVARAAALVGWLLGAALYLTTLCCVVRRLVRHPPGPVDAAPSYWIAMGAAAITLLAGCGLGGLSGTGTGADAGADAGARGGWTGVLAALWVWATLLLLPLAAAGAWRHLRHRVPVAYEPALWSMVFPLGMYAAATSRLASVLHVPPLRPWSEVAAWCAAAAWLGVGALLLARRLVDRTHTGAARAGPGANGGTAQRR